MTVFGKDTVNLNVSNITARSFVSVKRYHIVVTRSLKIFYNSVMTVTVKVYSVHIGRDRITEIKIKSDIFNRKIRSDIYHNGIIGRILYHQIRKTEVAHVVKKHYVSKIMPLVKFSQIDRIWVLILIIKIPDSTLYFKIVASIVFFRRKLVVIIPKQVVWSLRMAILTTTRYVRVIR